MRKEMIGVGVAFEMSLVYERVDDGTVLPIVLKGDKNTSLPGFFRLKAYTKFNKNPEEYYGKVLRLIGTMLGEGVVGSRDLMKEFNEEVRDKVIKGEIKIDKKKIKKWRDDKEKEEQEIDKKIENLGSKHKNKVVNWNTGEVIKIVKEEHKKTKEILQNPNNTKSLPVPARPAGGRQAGKINPKLKTQK